MRFAPAGSPSIRRILLLGLVLAGCATVGDVARAQSESGLPIPRFASLKASEANVRTGPGERYPIRWTYVQAGLPVEIIAEWEPWRKIRDWEGQEGWVHKALLTPKRRVIVSGETRTLYRRADRTSPPVVLLQPGIVADVEDCDPEWCRVEVRNYRGWLRRDEVWGLYPDEVIK